jgi:hypothetical protein
LLSGAERVEAEALLELGGENGWWQIDRRRVVHLA